MPVVSFGEVIRGGGSIRIGKRGMDAERMFIQPVHYEFPAEQFNTAALII